MRSRVEIVEGNLDAYLASAQPVPKRLGPEDALRPGSGLTARKAVELFEDQVLSRALDVAARELRRRNQGFYTISSAGHEQNAVVGAQLGLEDVPFLHYRSGALMMARARQRPGETPAFDTLLSLCAAAEDPISGGRHKVWGSLPLRVPPQTSTIASHLPKAVGYAFALRRARRLGIDPGVPRGSIVCCSFGDASANHATALSGIQAARYAQRRGASMPILFLCEDNGWGISVDTPRNWIRDTFGALPYLRYFRADGDVDQIWDTAAAAIEACRNTRGPVFLHLHCVRLWAHAGSDVETAYRTVAEIEGTETRDPILRNARRLVETGAADPATLQAIVRDTRQRVMAAAVEAGSRRRLHSAAQIMAPLAPYDEAKCRAAAEAAADPAERAAVFGDKLPEQAEAPVHRTLAAQLGAALTDAMARDSSILVYGEDVGRKGGVYGLTSGLQKRFGVARVFDTLLDETTILGVAQGAGMAGLLPVAEIQYLAYVHNAIDQLRGEAASLSFFSDGRFKNPMVVRIASFAYQKGFGGHFHNDNSIGALREIPGVVLAAPARGDDAARMLRGCLALAREHGRVVCFLEPIALYHERDLYEEGDGGWLSDYPPPGSALLPGEVGVYGDEHSDVLVATYANGLRLSLRAARTLEREHGIGARVLDLRWLNPLPFEALRRHAQECKRVVVVDECRATGAGIADALIAALAESGYDRPVASVRAADTYVPLGPAADLVLVSETDIVERVRKVCA